MKKMYVLLIAFFLLPITAQGQESVNQIFKKFSTIKGAENIQVGNFLMFLGGFFTDTKGVTGVEVLGFESCDLSLKEKVRNAILSVKDPEYELLVSVKDDHEQLRVLSRMKNDHIRELIILNAGDDPAMVRIRGNINPSDIQELINQ